MASTIRVLCVDDEPELVALVADYLTNNADDMMAVAATDARDALSILENEPVDCVVCDYQIPGMSGLDILDAAREIDPDLPFILFTGRGSEHIAAEAIRAGVSDYITKSAGTENFELLANRVRNLVERYRARRTTRSLFNAANDAILVHDVETGEIVDENDRAIDLWQVDDGTLIGRYPAALTAEATDQRAWLAETPSARAPPEDWECQRLDGKPFWAEIKVREATIDGEDRLLTIARDVTRRKRRERRLNSMLSAAEELLFARDLTSVGDVVTRTLTEHLEFDGAMLFVRENDGPGINAVSESGMLRVDGSRIEAEAARFLLGGTNELRHDGGANVAVSRPDRTDELLYWTLANDAVLVGDPSPQERTPYTLDLVDLLVAMAHAAVIRSVQDRQLERQHRELQSLNHMNEVIRDINQTLVKVSTRDEIEHLVCKQLAAASPFVCAWMGEHDMTDKSVSVRVAVGRGADVVRSDEIPADGETDDPLGGAVSEVIQNREVVIIDRLDPDAIGASRASHASKHGYESLTIVPITYQNALYDILAIYAEVPRPFGHDERAVLQELGDTIGYAMHTAERSRALLSDTRIELEYQIRGGDDVLLGLSGALDTVVSLERIFFRPDNSARLFIRIEDGSVDEVRAFLSTAVVDVESIREIAQRKDGTVVEISVAEFKMMNHLAEAMATIRAVTANAGDGRLVIEVPNSVSVRTLSENLATVFDECSLLARRQRDREDDPSAKVEDADGMGLTNRQHEVLLTAYHAGFFTWPRESTGEEIASLLDISQPTFHEHLRTGERKLLELLFEHRRSVYT